MIWTVVKLFVPGHKLKRASACLMAPWCTMYGVVEEIPQWVKDLDLGSKEQQLFVQAMRQEARDLLYPTLSMACLRLGLTSYFLACQSWGDRGGHVLTNFNNYLQLLC